MRRRWLSLAAALAAVLVVTLAHVPAAVAGGGCHDPATESRGTTVSMKDFCYAPTVLRVPAGGQVTFVNRDVVDHPTSGRGTDWSVVGAAGRRTTVRFDRPGVYPYYCHEHIGMVGVVVVGDGQGKAAAAVQVVEPPAAPRAPAEVAAEPAAARQTTPSPLPAVVLIGLGLVGASLVVLARRRRDRGDAATPHGDRPL